MGRRQFKVMSIQSMIFFFFFPIKQACWRSLLQKFKVQEAWVLSTLLYSYTPTLLTKDYCPNS